MTVVRDDRGLRPDMAGLDRRGAVEALGHSEERFGRPSGDLEPILAAFLGLIHPADRERARLRIQTAHRSGVPFAFEHPVLLPGGVERTFAVRGDVVTGPGRPTRVTVMVQDVTERRAAEAALERYAADVAAANAELEAAHELKDHFLAVTNHELRSPLTTLATSAEVLRGRRDELPERARNALDLLEADVRRFQRLVEDLLEMSRLGAGAAEVSLEPVRMEELVIHALHSASAGDVPVDVDPDARGIVVDVDKRRMERVIANLVDNARSHAGGVLRTVVETGDHNVVRVAVEDGGPGVPPEDRDRIFEPFVRGRAAGRRGSADGTGLGLALVAEHVRLNGGRVWVEERLGGGARFVVELPETST